VTLLSSTFNCSFVVAVIFLITHADGNRGVGFLRPFDSLCFPHDISKTDVARITKLDIEMFHDESWKPIYFGVTR